MEASIIPMVKVSIRPFYFDKNGIQQSYNIGERVSIVLKNYVEYVNSAYVAPKDKFISGTYKNKKESVDTTSDYDRPFCSTLINYEIILDNGTTVNTNNCSPTYYFSTDPSRFTTTSKTAEPSDGIAVQPIFGTEISENSRIDIIEKQYVVNNTVNNENSKKFESGTFIRKIPKSDKFNFLLGAIGQKLDSNNYYFRSSLEGGKKVVANEDEISLKGEKLIQEGNKIKLNLSVIIKM